MTIYNNGTDSANHSLRGVVDSGSSFISCIGLYSMN